MPPLGDLLDPGIKTVSLKSPALAGRSFTTAAAAVNLLQSCPTLCNPIDGSPPDSPVPGLLQARTLEWVAISFSNAWKWKVKGKSLSRVWLFATPWTAAYQAPPSMEFSRQEYWSGVPLPSLPLPLALPRKPNTLYHLQCGVIKSGSLMHSPSLVPSPQGSIVLKR